MSQFTSEWYLQRQAKSAASLDRGRLSADAVEVESELHRDILDYCKQKRWYVIHSRMNSRTTTSLGVPDFICFARFPKVFAIEAKTRTGKLTPEQAGTLLWLKQLGWEAQSGVVRSLEEFKAIVER